MQIKHLLLTILLFVNSVSWAEQALTVATLSDIALMSNDYIMQEYLGDVYYYSDQADIATALKWYQIAANQSAYAASQAGKILRLGEHGVVDCEQAIEYAYKERLLSRGEVDSGWLDNVSAWVYATCDDDGFRDGRRAVTLLQVCFDESKLSLIPVYVLDTLAAAYASVGEFSKARQYQKEVVAEVGRAQGNTKEFLSHLNAYEKGLPWIESTKNLSRYELLETLSLVDREIFLLRKKRKIAENFYSEINSHITDIYVRLARLYFDKKDYFTSGNYVSRARINGVAPETLKQAGIDLPE